MFAAYNSELTRTLFPVESADNIKIKITRHRVTGDEFIWKGMPFMRMYFMKMRYQS